MQANDKIAYIIKERGDILGLQNIIALLKHYLRTSNMKNDQFDLFKM